MQVTVTASSPRQALSDPPVFALVGLVYSWLPRIPYFMQENPLKSSHVVASEHPLVPECGPLKLAHPHVQLLGTWIGTKYSLIRDKWEAAISSEKLCRTTGTSQRIKLLTMDWPQWGHPDNPWGKRPLRLAPAPILVSFCTPDLNRAQTYDRYITEVSIF